MSNHSNRTAISCLLISLQPAQCQPQLGQQLVATALRRLVLLGAAEAEDGEQAVAHRLLPEVEGHRPDPEGAEGEHVVEQLALAALAEVGGPRMLDEHCVLEWRDG